MVDTACDRDGRTVWRCGQVVDTAEPAKALPQDAPPLLLARLRVQRAPERLRVRHDAIRAEVPQMLDLALHGAHRLQRARADWRGTACATLVKQEHSEVLCGRSEPEDVLTGRRALEAGTALKEAEVWLCREDLVRRDNLRAPSVWAPHKRAAWSCSAW